MAKGESKKAGMAQAVRSVGRAIRSQKDEMAENRRTQANNIMAWANLTFAGLVIAQVFSETFNATIAVVGGLTFLAAYYFSDRIMKGGDQS